MILDVQQTDDNHHFLKPEIVAKYNNEYADEFLLQLQEIHNVFTSVRYDEANGTYTSNEEVEKIRTRFFMNMDGEIDFDLNIL